MTHYAIKPVKKWRTTRWSHKTACPYGFASPIRRSSVSTNNGAESWPLLTNHQTRCAPQQLCRARPSPRETVRETPLSSCGIHNASLPILHQLQIQPNVGDLRFKRFMLLNPLCSTPLRSCKTTTIIITKKWCLITRTKTFSTLTSKAWSVGITFPFKFPETLVSPHLETGLYFVQPLSNWSKNSNTSVYMTSSSGSSSSSILSLKCFRSNYKLLTDGEEVTPYDRTSRPGTYNNSRPDTCTIGSLPISNRFSAGAALTSEKVPVLERLPRNSNTSPM